MSSYQSVWLLNIHELGSGYRPHILELKQRKRGDLKRIILWNQHVIEKLLREYVQGSNFWILGLGHDSYYLDMPMKEFRQDVQQIVLPKTA